MDPCGTPEREKHGAGRDVQEHVKNCVYWTDNQETMNKVRYSCRWILVYVEGTNDQPSRKPLKGQTLQRLPVHVDT